MPYLARSSSSQVLLNLVLNLVRSFLRTNGDWVVHSNHRHTHLAHTLSAHWQNLKRYVSSRKYLFSHHRCIVCRVSSCFEFFPKVAIDEQPASVTAELCPICSHLNIWIHLDFCYHEKDKRNLLSWHHGTGWVGLRKKKDAKQRSPKGTTSSFVECRMGTDCVQHIRAVGIIYSAEEEASSEGPQTNTWRNRQTNFELLIHSNLLWKRIGRLFSAFRSQWLAATPPPRCAPSNQGPPAIGRGR